ncbi:hypothetical protein BELL_0398g00100 [Botrytis elliptica]|uniref:FAD-binding PCMH-type domain-containing protein n=1 Tax=Botrytis elliptica TaxID=278938 RepID=A0A4Z1JH84_9HELO|nr:hypothetical protein EAE99_003178 [Botrytis elliptica]TGO73021.1 hypothetical protein BELL_0398g00100 [Botrytis elliptica]
MSPSTEDSTSESHSLAPTHPTHPSIKALQTSLQGEIIFKPENDELTEDYKNAIDRYNKAFIKESSLIIFCHSENDIIASLSYIQKHNLDFTVAGGRHSYYGASSCDGVIIDLGKMRKVSIDKENLKITAQGGCRAADLETPLQAEGLSVVMGLASDTGIAGLTLGGGSGPLTGRYGLVIDNLLSARVVIANGIVLNCSKDENSDLFWGIRGGGPNFGIVVEFTYRVHKQVDVCHGPLVYGPEKTKALLELVDTMPEIPTVPMSGIHPICIISYDGPEEEARKLTAPLWDLQPVMSAVSMKPFANTTKPSGLVDEPPNHQNFSSTSVFMPHPFNVEIMEKLIQEFDDFHNKHGDALAPSRIIIEMRSYKVSGAIPASATALAAREKTVSVTMEAQYDSSQVSHTVMREEIKRMIGPVKEAVKNQGSGKFTNANLGSGTEKTQDMFGQNYARLREIKRKYDPEFIFNKWYPIPPAEQSYSLKL